MDRSLSALLVGLSVAVACSRTVDQLPDDLGEGAGGSTFAATGPTVASSSTTAASGSSGASTGSASSSAQTSSGVTTASATTSVSATSSSSGGPVDCLLCVNSECPEVQACILDPVCSQGLVCIFTDCGTSNPDLQCAIDCFGGDFGAALDGIQAIGCVFTSCGDECAGLIPQGA